MLNLKFDLHFGEFLRLLPEVSIRATIHNSAKDSRGFLYFHRVDEGRGPVRPVRAKMLRWESLRYPNGAFRRQSGPAPARHIRAQAFRAGAADLYALAATSSATRLGMIATVNRLAHRFVLYLLRFTPTGLRGRLRKSYWVEPAR